MENEILLKIKKLKIKNGDAYKDHTFNKFFMSMESVIVRMSLATDFGMVKIKRWFAIDTLSSTKEWCTKIDITQPPMTQNRVSLCI